MTEAKRRPRKGPNKRWRGPKKATPDYLERSALHYLDRYAASSAHLKRLLLAKVSRSAHFHGTDAEAGAAAVEHLIADLRQTGLLDDAAYAAARARSLHRRGASARAIRGKLTEKGLPPELIDQALAGLDDESPEPELSAALAFARRRRLGPYRRAGERRKRRERDLAALGRQGFDLNLARRVIDAPDLADLEAEAAG